MTNFINKIEMVMWEVFLEFFGILFYESIRPELMN